MFSHFKVNLQLNKNLIDDNNNFYDYIDSLHSNHYSKLNSEYRQNHQTQQHLYPIDNIYRKNENENNKKIQLQPLSSLIKTSTSSPKYYGNNNNNNKNNNNNYDSLNYYLKKSKFINNQDQLTPQSNSLISPPPLSHIITGITNYQTNQLPSSTSTTPTLEQISIDQQLTNCYSNTLIPSYQQNNSITDKYEMLDNIEIIQDNKPVILDIKKESLLNSNKRLVPNLSLSNLNDDNFKLNSPHNNHVNMISSNQTSPSKSITVPNSPNIYNNNNNNNNNNNSLLSPLIHYLQSPTISINTTQFKNKRKFQDIEEYYESLEDNEIDENNHIQNENNNTDKELKRKELIEKYKEYKEKGNELKRNEKEKQDKINEPIRKDLISRFMEKKLDFKDLSTDQLLIMAPKVFGRVSKYNLFEFLFGTTERGNSKVSDIVRYRDRLDRIIENAKQEFNYWRCPYCEDIIRTQKALSQPHENRFSNKSCLKYHLLRIHQDTIKQVVVEKNDSIYDKSDNPNYRKCRHTGCPVWITSKHMCDHIIIDHHIENPDEAKNCQKCLELKKKLKKDFSNQVKQFYNLNLLKTLDHVNNNNENIDLNNFKKKNKKTIKKQ